MRRRLAAAVLLAVGIVLLPAPAGATTVFHFAVERGAGMPTTAEPARTINQVGVLAHLEDDGTARVEVHADLAAEPTESTRAYLRIAYGTDDGGDCTPTYEKTVATFAPDDQDVRDGTFLTVTGAVDREVAAGFECAVVEVLEPLDPSAVLDRWSGPHDSTAILDHTSQAKIVDVDHRRLPVDRWSYVEVSLKIRFHEASSVLLDGRGRGLDVRPVVVHGDFDRRERLRITLPVRLRADGPRRLTVMTTVSGVPFPFPDRERVVVRPR